MNNVINQNTTTLNDLRNLDLKIHKKVDNLYDDLKKNNERLEKKIK